MIIFYIVLALAILLSVRKRIDVGAWCCKDDSDAIKGVFIILVFLAHARGYLHDAPAFWGDVIVGKFAGLLGQLVVVPFLFLSGYGVSESIAAKGRKYLVSFPHRRILPVVVNFDIAVLVFAVLWLAMHGSLPMEKFTLSLVAWDSLGNSNWYIFAIVLCYLGAYMSARFSNHPAVFTFAIVFTITQILSFVKPECWYNTMMAFPLGMFFSEHKVKISEFIAKRYLISIAGSAIVFMSVFALRCHDFNGIIYNMLSMAFSALMVIVMFRIRLKNNFLMWAGRNVFPLYIYQRLPMIVLSMLGINIKGGGVFFIAASFSVTALVVLFYPKFRFRYPLCWK